VNLKQQELTTYKYIFIISGIAALLAGFVFRRNLSAEYFLLKSFGLFSDDPKSFPSTIIEWYSLFKYSKFVGLLLMNLFDMINFILLGLMYLGLYILLKDTNKTLMQISFGLVLIGIVLYIPSNQAFSILSLSNQYYSSTDIAEKTSIITAGRALLKIHDVLTSYGYRFFPSYFCVTLGGLFCSIVMYKSVVINKSIAIIGLIGTLIGLTYYITAITEITLSVIPIAGSAPFLMIWYILIGIKLLRNTGKTMINRKVVEKS
jgi:hypothetical protein